MATDKELRAMRRDIEEHHDQIEEELAALQMRHAALTDQIAPLEADRRALEAKMDALKGPLHEKRLALAQAIKEAN